MWLTKLDILVMWRDFFIGLTWFVVVIYTLSGIQDFVYDIWGYSWRIARKIRFRRRKRLSLERLKLREQQMLAVFVPAWKESGVINKMLDNIVNRVDYNRYIIFVGTYPNDPETQNAVDELALKNPQIVKVVTSTPGPTNKADCLNHIYRAMKEYEEKNKTFFEIIVMHDAEDFVHPYSFLLYNYLIPRVDAIQLPILPLPTKIFSWVHWTYADEFAENHMKDIMVRERMKGFVPYAGVGTGFSRRFFNYLELKRKDSVFNDGSLTEDYSAARAGREAGLTSIFVNIILADDKSPWYRPLSKREYFISNWAYFPSDFGRAVRQKTRWITGIALQEWATTRWSGTFAVKENLIKDRKGMITSACNLLGYLIFLYVIIYLLGRYKILPFEWEPLFHTGTLLFSFIIVATIFMIIRIIQRIVFVTIVYGIGPGLLSVPRLFVSNVINGVASFRAVKLFLKTWNQPKIKWGKTEHREGHGVNPILVTDISAEDTITCQEFLEILRRGSITEIAEAIERLRYTCSSDEERQTMEGIMKTMSESMEIRLRVMATKILMKFNRRELFEYVEKLLYDKEWIVRANAAKAIIQTPFLSEAIKNVFKKDDLYAQDIMIKTLEQNDWAFDCLFDFLQYPEMAEVRTIILDRSEFLRDRFNLKTKSLH
ncbi:MAG: glycosyltransferase [bacterium]|nr:glycosyltransferase [bacterium]